MRNISFHCSLYQRGAIYERDIHDTHGTTDYTRLNRKSVELLFYDERNFVAIIGSKLLPATRDPRETRNVNVCIIMITCAVILCCFSSSRVICVL